MHARIIRALIFVLAIWFGSDPAPRAQRVFTGTEIGVFSLPGSAAK